MLPMSMFDSKYITYVYVYTNYIIYIYAYIHIRFIPVKFNQILLWKYIYRSFLKFNPGLLIPTSS